MANFSIGFVLLFLAGVPSFAQKTSPPTGGTPPGTQVEAQPASKASTLLDRSAVFLDVINHSFVEDTSYIRKGDESIDQGFGYFRILAERLKEVSEAGDLTADEQVQFERAKIRYLTYYFWCSTRKKVEVGRKYFPLLSPEAYSVAKKRGRSLEAYDDAIRVIRPQNPGLVLSTLAARIGSPNPNEAEQNLTKAIIEGAREYILDMKPTPRSQYALTYNVLILTALNPQSPNSFLLDHDEASKLFFPDRVFVGRPSKKAVAASGAKTEAAKPKEGGSRLKSPGELYRWFAEKEIQGLDVVKVSDAVNGVLPVYKEAAAQIDSGPKAFFWMLAFSKRDEWPTRTRTPFGSQINAFVFLIPRVDSFENALFCFNLLMGKETDGDKKAWIQELIEVYVSNRSREELLEELEGDVARVVKNKTYFSAVSHTLAVSARRSKFAALSTQFRAHDPFPKEEAVRFNGLLAQAASAKYAFYWRGRHEREETWIRRSDLLEWMVLPLENITSADLTVFKGVLKYYNKQLKSESKSEIPVQSIENGFQIRLIVLLIRRKLDQPPRGLSTTADSVVIADIGKIKDQESFDRAARLLAAYPEAMETYDDDWFNDYFEYHSSLEALAWVLDDLNAALEREIPNAPQRIDKETYKASFYVQTEFWVRLKKRVSEVEDEGRRVELEGRYNRALFLLSTIYPITGLVDIARLITMGFFPYTEQSFTDELAPKLITRLVERKGWEGNREKTLRSSVQKIKTEYQLAVWSIVFGATWGVSSRWDYGQIIMLFDSHFHQIDNPHQVDFLLSVLKAEGFNGQFRVMTIRLLIGIKDEHDEKVARGLQKTFDSDDEARRVEKIVANLMETVDNAEDVAYVDKLLTFARKKNWKGWDSVWFQFRLLKRDGKEIGLQALGAFCEHGSSLLTANGAAFLARADDEYQIPPFIEACKRDYDASIIFEAILHVKDPEDSDLLSEMIRSGLKEDGNDPTLHVFVKGRSKKPKKESKNESK